MRLYRGLTLDRGWGRGQGEFLLRSNIRDSTASGPDEHTEALKEHTGRLQKYSQ